MPKGDWTEGLRWAKTGRRSRHDPLTFPGELRDVRWPYWLVERLEAEREDEREGEPESRRPRTRAMFGSGG